eukprot:TRINITY_DN2534_c0_g1_i4.p1 TRINITY_DN2534_c0_g1~~TRINITY_DN2534_c0_g1_i4.p1  ORF type:complete len:308 (-),score=78.40 TRINITY_DN2534_c0_g1_i4:132-1055(-)
MSKAPPKGKKVSKPRTKKSEEERKDPKWRERRDKNNEAVKRSREKNKNELDDLQRKVEAKKAENAHLVRKNYELDGQLFVLRKFVKLIKEQQQKQQQSQTAPQQQNDQQENLQEQNSTAQMNQQKDQSLPLLLEGNQHAQQQSNQDQEPTQQCQKIGSQNFAQGGVGQSPYHDVGLQFPPPRPNAACQHHEIQSQPMILNPIQNLPQPGNSQEPEQNVQQKIQNQPPQQNQLQHAIVNQPQIQQQNAMNEELLLEDFPLNFDIDLDELSRRVLISLGEEEQPMPINQPQNIPIEHFNKEWSDDILQM